MTTADRFAALAAKARARTPTKAANRERHPEFSAWLDGLRDACGATLFVVRADGHLWVQPLEQRPAHAKQAIESSLAGRVWTHYGQSVEYRVKRKDSHARNDQR